MEESVKEEIPGDDVISDFEGSQVSLPRTYTLPREFKYRKPFERKEGAARLTGSRYYLPSTNSSDGTYHPVYCIFRLLKADHLYILPGDVDSADNEEETDSELHVRVLPDIQGNNRRRPQADLYNNHNFQSSPSIVGLRASPYVRSKIKPETRL